MTLVSNSMVHDGVLAVQPTYLRNVSLVLFEAGRWVVYYVLCHLIIGSQFDYRLFIGITVLVLVLLDRVSQGFIGNELIGIDFCAAARRTSWIACQC
jgi:hypothetical protein